MNLQQRLTLSFIVILLISIIPITLFSLKIISDSIELWVQEDTEETLKLAIDKIEGEKEQHKANEVLKGYLQIKALKEPIKREIIGFSLFLAIIEFMAAIGLAWLFILRLTKPLKKLTSATQQIAGGEFDVRLNPCGSSEIRQLINSFNLMAESLKRSREELKKATKRAAWQEVAQALAHEIKNPLTPIQLSIERIKRKYPGEEVAPLAEVTPLVDKKFGKILEEDTTLILQEIESLKRLTDEFSQFARMPELRFKNEAINPLVEDLMAGYLNNYPGIVFNLKLEKDLPLVPIDVDSLRRVLINIIKNAIEAMPDGGTLEIRSKCEKKVVIVEVNDTGIGISKDELPYLFEPHYSRKKEGIGLGLAIAREIIEGHKGRIEVESKIGAGTIFRLILPVPDKLGIS